MSVHALSPLACGDWAGEYYSPAQLTIRSGAPQWPSDLIQAHLPHSPVLCMTQSYLNFRLGDCRPESATYTTSATVTWHHTDMLWLVCAILRAGNRSAMQFVSAACLS